MPGPHKNLVRDNDDFNIMNQEHPRFSIDETPLEKSCADVFNWSE